MPKPTDGDPNATPQQQQPPGAPAFTGDLHDLAHLIQLLANQGGPAPAPINTHEKLVAKPRVTVAFPPCASELLSLVRTEDLDGQGKPDEVSAFFNEYFKFTRHRTLGQDNGGRELATELSTVLDPALIDCVSDGHQGVNRSKVDWTPWPSDCCICSPCVTLNGDRDPPPPPDAPTGGIRRLFLGDVVWLFYFERMGLNQILGAILDAFSHNGRLPISNGTIDVGPKDDVVALVLEIMVRQMRTGMASTVRDRASLTRRTIGWVSEGGRRLNVDSEVNSGFSTLFHKFLFHALEFYRDKRLAIAIQGAAGSVARPSTATLVTIRETLELLTKRFEPFQYGRNYYNTLNGIIWEIAALSVIRALAGTIGIPSAFGDPYEFVPAAYDLLVLKRPVTSGDTNRYIVHRECARNGRDILLDLEVINFSDTAVGGALETWLTQVEPKVEAYRTAYRSMTGVDVGASPNPIIEQQA